MSKPLITIHNIETNEIIEREMTEAELEQKLKDEADALALKEAIADANQKRLNALNKLEALGLDLDDLKALGLG